MKLVVTLTSLCLLMLCSCQKEIDPLNIVTRTDSTVVTTNDSTSLVKYVDLDTTLPAGMDTLVVQTYAYDNLKRLINVNTFEYYGNSVPDNVFRTSLYYNNSDTLPYRKNEQSVDLTNNSVTRTIDAYYTYSNGVLLTDSSSENNGQYTIAKRFSYATGKITETASHNGMIGLPEIRNIYTVRTNGNLTAQTDTVTNSASINRFTFTYDNRKNPFFKLPQSSLDRTAPYYEMETYSEEMVYEPNNPLDINEYHNNENFHLRFSYIYKANGYPASAVVTDLSTGTGTTPGFIYKRLFFYTKL